MEVEDAWKLEYHVERNSVTKEASLSPMEGREVSSRIVTVVLVVVELALTSILGEGVGIQEVESILT